LVENGQFAERLFTDPEKVRLLEVVIGEQESTDEARREVEQGDFEAVVYVPADFAQRLGEFREELRKAVARQGQGKQAKLTGTDDLEIPSPEIYYNTAKEKSQLAYIR